MYFTIFWVNDSEKSKGGTLWCKRAPIESKNKDQGFCEMQLLRLFYIKGSPLWYKRASIALKTWIKDFINCIYCGSFTSKGPPFGFFKIIDVLWKKSLNRFKFTKLLILAHCAAPLAPRFHRPCNVTWCMAKRVLSSSLNVLKIEIVLYL